MRKNRISRVFCVSLAVWTVLLLSLQFSPAFVHTQTLQGTEADYAAETTEVLHSAEKPMQSVTVQTESEAVSEKIRSELSADTTQIAQPQTQQADEPTQSTASSEIAEPTEYTECTEYTEFTEHSDCAEPFDEAVTQTQVPDTTFAQNLSQTEQMTSATEDETVSTPTLVQTEAVTVPPLAESEALPVLPAQTVADSGNTGSLRPLRFGAEVSVSLPGENSGVVYVLTVTERGSVQYKLTYPSVGAFSTVGWKVTMYEEYDRLGLGGGKAYRRLNILSSTTAATAVTSAAIGVQPGTYRLVLEQNGSFSRDEVTLLADFTAENNREIEPNDIPERYTEIYPGHAVIGACGKYESSTVTDEDWYLFFMDYDGTAHYTFRHEAMDMVSVGWQIYLYDSDLNLLSFNNAALSQNAVTGEQVGLGEGFYFICIKGRVHSPQNYTLSVETERADNFEQEGNDTADDATPIQAGKAYSGMMNNRSQNVDYDYYRIRVDKPGSLTVTFSHEALEEEKAGWNISLLNKDGAVLYSDVSDWSDTDTVSPEMGVAAGDYYVRIDSDNRYINSAVYTVQVDHVSDGSFESEPNNKAEKATPLYANKTVKGSLTQDGLNNDVDCYALTLTADSQVQLTFSHAVLESDRAGWKISLTDADGRVYTPFDKDGLPYTDANGSISDRLISNWNAESADGYFRLPAGRYIIRVEAADYFSNITYSLHAAVERSQ